MTTDRFCRSCGAPIAPDASFCESCGRAAEVSPAAQAPSAVAPSAAAARLSRLPIVAGVAVLILGLVAVVIWWTGEEGASGGALGQGGGVPAATAAPTYLPETAAASVTSPTPKTPSPSTPTPETTPTTRPHTPAPTATRTSTATAGDLRPLLGDWDVRSVLVTEDGDTTDQTEELHDTFIRLLTRNDGASVVIEIWMPYTESFELTEVTLRQVGTGRYEGAGEADDGTVLNVTARLSDGNNRLNLTFVDASPLADPPDTLVLALVRRSAGGGPAPTATAAALDLRRPETYLPAPGRHFSYVERYVDGSGSTETEAIAARIPDGPAISRLELTPDAYEGMLTIAMHFVTRGEGVYLAYDSYPTDLQLWLARDLVVGRRWQVPGTPNGPGGVQAFVVETGGACPLTQVSLSNCMTVRVEYVDAGYTFIQWYAPGHGEVLRKDAANMQTLMGLVAVEDIGESMALAIVRPEAPNLAQVPR